jgi:hypothetical protein
MSGDPARPAPLRGFLLAAVLLGGCFRSHRSPPDGSGCFQGAYPSSPSELRRATALAPALVTTQLAGLHVLVRDAGQADRPIGAAWVWLGDDDESRRRAVGTDGGLTLSSLTPGDTRIRLRVFGFEPGAESVRVRAGYIDTLVFRRGYVGNECHVVPNR